LLWNNKNWIKNNMKTSLSIGEASIMIGVSITTLRRWHKSLKLVPKFNTFGGHRRYHIQQILSIINPNKNNENRVNIGYARVSSHDQKKDLETQKKRLELECKNLPNFSVMSDLGSGLNYKKKGLKLLIMMICQSKIDKLIITHKDRLLRFGSEIIFQLCNYFGTEVVILEKVDKTFEEELTCDVIELMTVFSARLYGKRSHQNRKKLAVA
jgi:putative resolvase